MKGFQQLDSSIIAKAPRVVTLLTGPASSADGMHVLTQAHMSIGKVYEKLNDPNAAAKHMTEGGGPEFLLSDHHNIHMSAGLRIFRHTVGGASPLTAHAMASLGKLRAAQVITLSEYRALACLPVRTTCAQGISHRQEALVLLKGALHLEVANTHIVFHQMPQALSDQVSKDAFHLETVWELLMHLKDLNIAEAKQQQSQPIQSQALNLFVSRLSRRPAR